MIDLVSGIIFIVGFISTGMGIFSIFWDIGKDRYIIYILFGSMLIVLSTFMMWGVM